MGDVVHGLDHGLVHRAFRQVFYEAAVDFHAVDREVSKIGEGGEAGAEIIQRGEAAYALEFA